MLISSRSQVIGISLAHMSKVALIGSHANPAEGEAMESTLYLNGLPDYATDQELRELCAPYGAVEWAHVATNRLTGQSVGFGFVKMGAPEDARKAVSALDGIEPGRAVVTSIFNPIDQGLHGLVRRKSFIDRLRR
jgi:RNA recognition motif-containing protein